MDIRNCASIGGSSCTTKAPFKALNMLAERGELERQDKVTSCNAKANVEVDFREVYFLIMHFLSSGPFQRTIEQFQNELLENQLLPRRYHAWFSRTGAQSGNDNDDGVSLPLGYDKLVERYPHIEKDHLLKLLKELLLHTASPLDGKVGRRVPNAADVPTLLGTGSFSLLDSDRSTSMQARPLPLYLRWPHHLADQVHGLGLREIGGGFAKHHRAPAVQSACYAIAKPSTMVQKMQNIKKLRGHRTAVYCAIFDRSGRYVITGSDDRLVKIWSMETAFCLASCRGHEGDITDLAVNSSNLLVASASNDFVIRVWHLPNGAPISVLRGHSAAVTAIAFSPRPSAAFQLLSSSDDGTCRIWDARSSQGSLRIYVPKPYDAATGKSNGSSINGPSSSNSQQSNQILCCAYNANGTVFVTGSSDTYARVWSAFKSNTDGSDEPIHEIDVLAGHENDVNYVQFSGCAVATRSSMPDTLKEENVSKFRNLWFCHDNIVTCSRDGSAIIWSPQLRRSHGKSVRWSKSYHLKVPPPPLPPQPPRGGPRQRLLPTPRGVNMIVWSLDNRFVLAAIMDCRICVWNAADGHLVHSLTGHSASSYVLDVHPFNPRIAMSAGYDGKTIVWDIWEGIPIRIYEMGRFKLVDGKFSSDGTSIVLSDDVGQIYLISTGQGDSQKDAKYDQFFLGDYRPLIQDTAGNVIDQETQLPPHRRNHQDLLCDSSIVPYPEPYQSMFQQRRLGALGVEWRPSSLKFAVGPDINLFDYQMPLLEDLDNVVEPVPEFIDAMYWEPEIEVISDDTDSEYNLAEECTSEGEQGSLSNSSFSDPDCSADETDAEHGQKDSLRKARRRKRMTEVESMTPGRRVKRRNLDECGSSLSGTNRTKKLQSGKKPKKKSPKAKSLRPQRLAARNALNSLSRISGSSTEEDDEEESEDYTSHSESGLQDSNIQDKNSARVFQNVQEKSKREGKVVLAEAKDTARAKHHKLPEAQSVNGNRKPLKLKISIRDPKQPMSSEDGRLHGENHVEFSSLPSGPLEGTSINISSEDPGSSSTNVMPSNFESSTSDIAGTNHSQEMKENSSRKLTKIKLKTRPVSRDSIKSSSIPEQNQFSHLKFGPELVGTSKHAGNEVLSEGRMSRSDRNRRQVVSSDNDTGYITKNESSLSPKLSWLTLSKQEESCRYIPQKGDEVVYLRQGHQEYIESTDSTQSQERGPWTSIKGHLSAVEICKVESLNYAQLPYGDGCCKMTLKFVDSSSGVYGKRFNLTLPELTGVPDFIVEKKWYDASISRNWSLEDKCRVWWRNMQGGGDWWEGRIISVQAKCEEFPDSPWEKYEVLYGTDPPEKQRHSPWEMHDPEVQWEHPHINFEIRDKLLRYFAKLERSVSRHQDRYGIQKLNEACREERFCNKFPVPLSPELIRSRLENNYYRSLEAVEHDINVMMEIAQTHFKTSTEMSRKINRLSEWISKKFLKRLSKL